jgi:hypothetical protein
LLRPIVVLALSFLCSATIVARAAPPERKVAGNVITSERDPSVRIELPKTAIYVGADRWVLYGSADCELHAWVDAGEGDAQKGTRSDSVRRLYWVQFEGYLPSRPDLRHTYDSPKRATIGGMDFYVDSWVRAKDAKTDAGSDREHIEALVTAKDYRMPEGMMYVRLVHLLDKEKRKELMIIYGEDLAPTRFTAADLSEGGKKYDRWPGIAEGLLERAKREIAIKFATP